MEQQFSRKSVWKLHCGLGSPLSCSERNNGNFVIICLTFQSFNSQKQLREIELYMVSAISFAWFADFVKPFTNYLMAIQTCLFLWQALLTQRQIPLSFIKSTTC